MRVQIGELPAPGQPSADTVLNRLGREVVISVYDDPDADGQPDDLRLLSQASFPLQSYRQADFLRFDIEDVRVSGSFFVSARVSISNTSFGVAGYSYAPGRHDSGPAQGRSWYTEDWCSSVFPTGGWLPLHQFVDGNYMIRADAQR